MRKIQILVNIVSEGGGHVKRITVEPAQLELFARKMDDENDTYQRAFTQLFDSVDTMRAAWQGKDNTAFTDQIKTFEDDLRQISIIMRQYADFLRNSARAYRETQDEIYAQANRLKTI